MNVFERVEEIARQGIAKAVLQDKQSSSVVGRGLHMGNSRITTHEGTIGSTTAILVFIEKNALVGASHANDTVVLIDLIVYIGCCIGDITWHVIDKVFWCLLHGDIFRITIHATHIAMYHLTVITG